MHQAGTRGKWREELQQLHPQQEQEDRRVLRSKYQPQPFEGEASVRPLYFAATLANVATWANPQGLVLARTRCRPLSESLSVCSASVPALFQ